MRFGPGVLLGVGMIAIVVALAIGAIGLAIAGVAGVAYAFFWQGKGVR